jgi:hypothetical protein
MDAYFIEACTGCTCCSDENFIQGPYLTLGEAQEEAESMYRCKRLASQYASRGTYYLYRYKDAEQLPDGRIICGHRIFEARPEDDVCYCPEEFRDDSFLYEDNLERLGKYGGQTHTWEGRTI